MKYKISLATNWHADRRRFFTPGIYRVPEDMDERIAERALKQPGANRIEVEKRRVFTRKKAPEVKIVEPVEDKSEMD